jgi:hypothetical protein
MIDYLSADIAPAVEKPKFKITAKGGLLGVEGYNKCNTPYAILYLS